MSDGGKGSKRRPTNEEAYRNSWAMIFGKKKEDFYDTQVARPVDQVTQGQSTEVEVAGVSSAKPTQQEQTRKPTR